MALFLVKIYIKNYIKNNFKILKQGGIGCGEGYPSWYTKVAYYRDWIDCVIENSILYDNNQKKVEETCKEKTSVKATCVKKADLIVQCTNVDANVESYC